MPGSSTFLHTSLELKAVDTEQRLIQGYANYFSNLDENGDEVAPGAFAKTLANTPMNLIAPIIGHDPSKLRIGMPVEIREDERGLFTSTRVFKTQAGDDLLQTAREMQEAGVPLGMSIGFQTIDAKFKKGANGKTVRVLTELNLLEYSYADPAFIANKKALVTGVKTKDTDAASDADSEAAHFAPENKAVWSAAYMNDLPDSAYAYVEPGGEKDAEGKTTPRSLRHFPHHDASGKLDDAHLRNALSRAPQSPFGDKAMPHLDKHAEAEGIGDRGSDGKIAHSALAEVSSTLADLSNEAADVAGALDIGGALGLDGQKVSVRLKGTMRAKLKSIAEAVAELVSWAENDEYDAPTDAHDGKESRRTVRALAAARAAAAAIWDGKAIDNKALASLHDGIDHMDTIHSRIIHPAQGCPLGVGGGENAKTTRKPASRKGPATPTSSPNDDNDGDTQSHLTHMHAGIGDLIEAHDFVHPGHDLRASYGYAGAGKDDDPADDGDADDGKDGKTGKKATEKKAAEKTEQTYDSFLADLEGTLARYDVPVEAG